MALLCAPVWLLGLIPQQMAFSPILATSLRNEVIYYLPLHVLIPSYSFLVLNDAACIFIHWLSLIFKIGSDFSNSSFAINVTGRRGIEVPFGISIILI